MIGGEDLPDPADIVDRLALTRDAPDFAIGRPNRRIVGTLAGYCPQIDAASAAESRLAISSDIGRYARS
jgi:hypothetical protein